MSVDYTIPAIPTAYNGRQYRSRLEAKWAAFFDLLKWPFEYEPIDFGSWSPDFQLISPIGQPIFVEVKPITYFDSSTADRMRRSVDDSQIVILLVGVSPLLPCGDSPPGSACAWHSSGSEIGWRGSPGEFGGCMWRPAYIAQDGSGQMDIFSMVGSYRLGAIYRNGQKPDEHPPWQWRENCDRVAKLWKSATNIVQWIPKP